LTIILLHIFICFCILFVLLDIPFILFCIFVILLGISPIYLRIILFHLVQCFSFYSLLFSLHLTNDVIVDAITRVFQVLHKVSRHHIINHVPHLLIQFCFCKVGADIVANHLTSHLSEVLRFDDSIILWKRVGKRFHLEFSRRVFSFSSFFQFLLLLLLSQCFNYIRFSSDSSSSITCIFSRCICIRRSWVGINSCICGWNIGISHSFF